MKQVLTFLLAVILTLSLVSCGDSADSITVSGNNGENEKFAFLEEKEGNDTDNDAPKSDGEDNNDGGAEYADDGTVYVTANGKKYHRATCHHVKDSKNRIAKDLEEAKREGYTACKVCFK